MCVCGRVCVSVCVCVGGGSVHESLNTFFLPGLLSLLTQLDIVSVTPPFFFPFFFFFGPFLVPGEQNFR